ncbi:hypothetical protein GIS00_10045 [Nakamurella sp. YIM 132087]|uniref:Integral membrane protein n=1 Tax=Nakamurella alba TaxID=2665158 RepID=A0A7K1FJL1_9ACTN|nr:hypothetical protein [Nakamurella alba]MTD14288.1 hypothetical protein [Nakamurella alba]
MIPALGYGLLAAGLVLGVWTGWQTYRRRPTSEAQMVGAIVVEAGLLVQAVIALIRMGGATLTEPVTFIAYTVGVLLPLPLGFQLARIERTRWGSLSLSFTAVVVAVMNLRLLQLWTS